jgi:outer membrane protein insertion porin family
VVKTGKPLNVADISESITRVRDLYANQGYINAEIDVATKFSEDKQQVDVTFQIMPGKQFFVGKILIQGVIRTKKSFIHRELRVKEGDVYNPQKIRETVRRLHQLGLYDSVRFRRLDTKSQEPVQDMLLEVSETSAKDVEFGVGYSTERGLRGFVEYADKNVFNFGGKGSARAELSIARPKLTLQYLHPHVGTQDTQLVASVFNEMQRDNDSFDLEERGMRLGIRHHFDETLSLSVGYIFNRPTRQMSKRLRNCHPLIPKF